jgi:squalene-associated FAD-dependent desaturase
LINKHISIIGGGWAGLAAAVELCSNNIPVTVFESARQLGGRARSVAIDNTIVDNGQHLMIGAYQQMLALLNTTGVDVTQVFQRIPQQLDMLNLKTGQSAFHLSLPKLPAPGHLLMGILRSPSLSLIEKLSTLWRFNRLLNKPVTTDISVDQWLEKSGLAKKYIHYLLKPLCLAALTTHSDKASARTFQSVLQQTFNGPASNTDLLIARTDLGNLFPTAAKQYIERHGGRVLTEHRVEKINFHNNQAISIAVNGQTLDIEHIILATSAHISHKLLSTSAYLTATCEQISRLEYAPITTLYLQYPKTAQLPKPMLGVVNACSEWLFDRRYCRQPGLIAVVISAHGPHMKLNNQALIKAITAELAVLFPHWPALISAHVIREKRACFICSVDNDANRPKISTAIQNLTLCGDYVYIEENNAPGLPSTLEGSLRSGVKCAQKLIQEHL